MASQTMFADGEHDSGVCERCAIGGGGGASLDAADDDTALDSGAEPFGLDEQQRIEPSARQAHAGARQRRFERVFAREQPQ